MNPSTTVESKILQAAIALVEKEGLGNITIRKIAKQADVNVAAINYYFRNKKGLLDALFQYTITNAVRDWYVILEQKELSIQARVRAFFTDFIQGGMRYPGITKAHLYDTFVNGNYQSLFMPQLNDFLKKLSDELVKSLPNQSRRHIQWVLAETMASVLFLITMPDLFQPFSSIRFTKTSAQKEYIDYLMDKFFSDIAPLSVSR